MSNPYFRFRQFTVWHDRCAMKVGTDGVLLGAWAWVDGCSRVLDVGCGSGVISLMAAQRTSSVQVFGIDVEPKAVGQAKENVSNSPYADRIVIHEIDVRDFVGKFDCIVCNPPFFVEDTVSPNENRAIARSSTELTYEELWHAVNRLNMDDGVFNVVIPRDSFAMFTSIAISFGYDVYRKLVVRTVQGKQPKRILLTYRKGRCDIKEDGELVLQNSDGSRTDEYNQLTAEFYLPVP